MKRNILILTLLMVGFSFAQERTKVQPNQITEKQMIKAKPAEKIKKPLTQPSLRPYQEMWGDFTIVSYNILSTKTAKAKELQALIGSLVKLKATNVTGTQIDPFSFEIFEIEQMSSSDYIYRTFGRTIRAPEPNLPASVKVHKTTHEDCYGIIQIDNDNIAIPYKGVLLFLERK